MKRIFMIFILVSSTSAFAEYQIIDKDYKEMTRLPNINDGQLFFGCPRDADNICKLVTAEAWKARGYTRPMVPTEWKLPRRAKEPQIFESRAAFLIRNYSEAKLASLVSDPVALLRSLDPINKHWRKNDPNDPETMIDSKDFKDPWVDDPSDKSLVKSRLYFPIHWRGTIDFVKSTTSLLSPETQPYVLMISHLDYFDKQTIETAPDLQAGIAAFGLSQKLPLAMITFAMYPIGHIAHFGNLTAYFYEVGPNEVLVYAIMAMAVKQKTLDIGKFGKEGEATLGYTGEDVLLGKIPLVNTSTGISCGLPCYTRELFKNMSTTFQKKFH